MSFQLTYEVLSFSFSLGDQAAAVIVSAVLSALFACGRRQNR